MGTFKIFKKLGLFSEPSGDKTCNQIQQECNNVLHITNIYSFNIGKIYAILIEILRTYHLENAKEVLPEIIGTLLLKIKIILEKTSALIKHIKGRLIDKTYDTDKVKKQRTLAKKWISQQYPCIYTKEILAKYLIKSSESCPLELGTSGFITGALTYYNSKTLNLKYLKDILDFQHTNGSIINKVCKRPKANILKQIYSQPDFHHTSKKLQQELKRSNNQTFTLTFVEPLRFVGHIIGVHKVNEQLYYLYDSNQGTSTFANVDSLISYLTKNYYKKHNPLTWYKLQKYYPTKHSAKDHYKNYCKYTDEYWLDVAALILWVAVLITIIISSIVALPALAMTIAFIADVFILIVTIPTLRNIISYTKKSISDITTYIAKKIFGLTKETSAPKPKDTLPKDDLEKIANYISKKYIDKVQTAHKNFMEDNNLQFEQNKTIPFTYSTLTNTKYQSTIASIEQQAYDQVLMFAQVESGQCAGLTTHFAQQQYIKALDLNNSTMSAAPH